MSAGLKVGVMTAAMRAIQAVDLLENLLMRAMARPSSPRNRLFVINRVERLQCFTRFLLLLLRRYRIRFDGIYKLLRHQRKEFRDDKVPDGLSDAKPRHKISPLPFRDGRINLESGTG